MPWSSDADFLVLHALRVKGFAETDTVSAMTGLRPDETVRRLEKAAGAEAVTRRDGRISGWSLTPAGRARHRDLVAEELAESGAREAVDAAYRRFVAINTELLEVCTAWQLRDGARNDHADPDHDQRVVARLGALDDVAQPVCGDLGAALGRFGNYGDRLAAARSRIEAGDGDWFAKPLIDSYHTVWFELHEDLLVTLGIERSKEGAS
ncbi:MAG TPA: hypothetical protein VF230_18015 [Acidimicrobiales bacterium]